MRISFIFLFLLVFLPNLGLAEVYYCDGKWSSNPCDEDSQAVNLPSISRGGAGVATPGENALDADAQVPPDAAAPAADQGPAAEQAKNTRLRVQGNPVWMLQNHGKSVELTSGEVVVKNVGSADADGVRVTVVVPGVEGGEAKLDGPPNIAKGASAKYGLQGNSTYFMPPGTSLYAKVYCNNCWH